MKGNTQGEPVMNGSYHHEKAIEPLLTANDVAALLGLSVDSVYNFARQGRLPRVRLDRAVRFRPADVRAFVERAAQPARLTKGGK